jgi:class 3 adenylate cyclase/tetratricopeptide (TPR) repeat protein
MKCPQCQTDNKEGSKFCLECGHEFQLKCPQCGHPFLPAAKFCDECGQSLSITPKASYPFLSFEEKLEKIQRYLPKGIAEKILTQRGKIEGEYKQVTVMFCDMEGYTSLVEKIGNVAAYQIMDQIYKILIHKVCEYEGTVNEMTGDGIMALFGAPIALEDAPLRALWTALAIHDELSNFSHNKKNLGPIRMRIGIHTGPTVVGALGNDLKVEFKAVGDTVNLASRMEEIAEPGTTYVTEEVFKLTRGIFQFDALGKVEIKGKDRPVAVYKVLSVKDDVYRPRLGSERVIYSDMIGRDIELNTLQRQVTEVIHGHHGSIVNIIGEAGIGKSRLIAELKKCGVMDQVTLLEGRATSIGRNLAYHPIRDILKQWVEREVDDRKKPKFDKLETFVKKLCHEKTGEVLPFVAVLMGIEPTGNHAARIRGIEGEALERLIFRSVRELLSKAAEQSPVVIIIEDLHWADASSIELLESLFHLVETQRILFINVFRPGQKETGDRIVVTINNRHRAYYTEQILLPLNERFSNTLINSMLNIGGLPHSVAAQIVERTGGNPFFIEEVVRSLIDEGALVPREGKFEITEKIKTTPIPSSVDAVVMARIDRLDEQTRNLVLIASVIGRTFNVTILTDVAAEIEAGIEHLEIRLSNLKAIQLIIERRNKAGEREYSFKHTLAKEAAYESILPQKRKLLHLKVAESIEKSFGKRLNEFYGILSYHFIKGENLDKAEEYMLKAGEEAMKSSASNEALSFYQKAMELYINKCGTGAEKNKIADLEENIALAFFNKGYFLEAVDYFERSLKNQGVKRSKNTLFIIFDFIANMISIIRFLYLPESKEKKIPGDRDNKIMSIKFKLAVSLAYVDMKRVFIDNIRNVPQAFKYDIAKSQIFFNVLIGGSALFAITGISFNLSKRFLDYAKSRLPDENEKGVISLHFFKFIESLYNSLSGNWQSELCEDIIYKTLKEGEVSSASGYLVWMGYYKIETGDFEAANRIIGWLNKIGDEYNFEHGKLDYYCLSAKLSMKRGDADMARKYVDEGITLLDKIGLDMRKVEFLGLKARILVLQNDLNAAGEIIEQADNLIRELGRHTILTNYYSEYLIGRFIYNVAILENRIRAGESIQIVKYKEDALKIGKQALRHFKKAAVGRTETYNLMGKYYWLIEKQQRGLKWWDRSIKEGKRLGAKLELSKTYSEVGKRLGETNSAFKELNGISGDEYIDRAGRLYKEMALMRNA